MGGMSNIMITYLAWNPEAWTDHPFPHTYPDLENHWRDLIGAYTYMGMDTIVLSAFPDIPGRTTVHDGEYARCARFLDALTAEREAGRTSLDACMMYEPWGETAEVIANRWRQHRDLLWGSEAYAYRDDRPLEYVWRMRHRYDEAAFRDAKRVFDPAGAGHSPYVVGRIRSRWDTEAQPIDDNEPVNHRIDRRYQYPQERYADFGACAGGKNHGVSYNAAAVIATSQAWLLRPDLQAFTAALAQPVPPGADRIFRDGEHNEAGTLLPAGQEWAYMTAVRKALVGA